MPQPFTKLFGVRLTDKQWEAILKNRSTQAYTMVILSLVTITFFGFLAIRPTLRTIATLQRQIEDKTLVNQKLDEKINQLITAQESYLSIQNDVSIIYSLLPDNPDFPSLLRKLEVLAVNNQATISGIQFSPIVLHTDTPTGETPSETLGINTLISPVTFTLTFEGSYTHLVNLLEQLTKLSRAVTINSVELQRGGGETSSLSISIQANVYYYPSP